MRRISYCVAPSSWRELPEDELLWRLEQLLLAGHAKRNYTLLHTEDPTPMELLSWDFEWMFRTEHAARP